MEYTLILPDGYKKYPLPLRDAWIADLRNPPKNVRQGKDKLRTVTHEKGEEVFLDCCLGRLSCIQGRLTNKMGEGENKLSTVYWRDGTSQESLDQNNPAFAYLNKAGVFPNGVFVKIHGMPGNYKWLTELNDNGLSFAQIADIIEQVWENA